MLITCSAYANETHCWLPTQSNLDLYFMQCMDQLLTKCTEIGADPLLTTCGSKVGQICRNATNEANQKATSEYKDCLRKISDAYQK